MLVVLLINQKDYELSVNVLSPAINWVAVGLFIFIARSTHEIVSLPPWIIGSIRVPCLPIKHETEIGLHLFAQMSNKLPYCFVVTPLFHIDFSNCLLNRFVEIAFLKYIHDILIDRLAKGTLTA